MCAITCVVPLIKLQICKYTELGHLGSFAPCDISIIQASLIAQEAKLVTRELLEHLTTPIFQQKRMQKNAVIGHIFKTNPFGYMCPKRDLCLSILVLHKSNQQFR